LNMYVQKELPGFKLPPTAWWPSVDIHDGSFRRDTIFEDFMSGNLGPTYDDGVTSLYTKEEIYRLFLLHHKSEIKFRESRKGWYPGNSYDANLFEYMRTFIVPPDGKWRPAPFARVLPTHWDIPDNAVIMHGAYNGVPHPGWIESLALVRRRFPDKRVIVGMAGNYEIDDIKGQVPEGNTKWRTSLFAQTNLMDGIFVVSDSGFNHNNGDQYPPERDWSAVTAETIPERRYDSLWSGIYKKSSRGAAFAVVANGEAEVQRKSLFINKDKTQIFDLHTQHRLFENFHSSEVRRWKSYSPEYVRDCWVRLRAEYL
jgi:hypothetical protein